MDKKILLLDFDGVIADTFHIAHSIAQKACAYLNDHLEYRKRFEGNIYETTKEFFTKDHGDKCDHDLDWWAHYTPRFYKHARPFEAMLTVLPKLAKDYTLVIVSSSRDGLIEHFLRKNQLESTVDGVYGMDKNPNKNEKIEEICSNYGVSPKQCVFVTDTLGDMNEAAGVGVSSIGVTWGFQDKATLERGAPFKIVTKPEELPAAVAEYFASVHEQVLK